MPLQHISDPMLTAMRRETSAQHIRDLIKRIRAGVPGIALRTTFIVGFPGETEEDFATLLHFIEETPLRATGRLPLLAGRRHPRGEDGRPRFHSGKKRALEESHGAATPDRAGANRLREGPSSSRLGRGTRPCAQ